MQCAISVAVLCGWLLLHVANAQYTLTGTSQYTQDGQTFNTSASNIFLLTNATIPATSYSFNQLLSQTGFSAPVSIFNAFDGTSVTGTAPGNWTLDPRMRHTVQTYNSAASCGGYIFQTAPDYSLTIPNWSVHMRVLLPNLGPVSQNITLTLIGTLFVGNTKDTVLLYTTYTNGSSVVLCGAAAAWTIQTSDLQNWQDLTCTFNSTSSVAILYVNGTLWRSGVVATDSTHTAGALTQVNIPASYSASGCPSPYTYSIGFNGLYVWNKNTLTAQDVALLWRLQQSRDQLNSTVFGYPASAVSWTPTNNTNFVSTTTNSGDSGRYFFDSTATQLEYTPNQFRVAQYDNNQYAFVLPAKTHGPALYYSIPKTFSVAVTFRQYSRTGDTWLLGGYNDYVYEAVYAQRQLISNSPIPMDADLKRFPLVYIFFNATTQLWLAGFTDPTTNQVYRTEITGNALGVEQLGVFNTLVFTYDGLGGTQLIMNNQTLNSTTLNSTSFWYGTHAFASSSTNVKPQDQLVVGSRSQSYYNTMLAILGSSVSTGKVLDTLFTNPDELDISYFGIQPSVVNSTWIATIHSSTAGNCTGAGCVGYNPCQVFNPCQNNQRCTSLDNGVSSTCICNSSYTGSTCERSTGITGCPLNYCQNNGTCDISTGVARCVCPYEYSGPTCASATNYCATGNACLNGGSCTYTGPGQFSCACAPGYTGGTCAQLINVCQTNNQCQNSAICTNTSQPLGYTCNCNTTDTHPGEWAGQNCDVPSNMCNTQFYSNPCQNGGVCNYNGAPFAYSCQCPVGWTGQNCAVPVDLCVAGPLNPYGGTQCQQSSACYSAAQGVLGTYICCVQPNPNGNYTLNPTTNSYQCYGSACGAQSPFSGQNCSTPINFCASSSACYAAGTDTTCNGFYSSSTGTCSYNNPTTPYNFTNGCASPIGQAYATCQCEPQYSTASCGVYHNPCNATQSSTHTYPCGSVGCCPLPNGAYQCASRNFTTADFATSPSCLNPNNCIPSTSNNQCQ